ncbi:MAG TPA: biotin/lipoyl-containing protein, partial [Acidimicrobiales bacterium]
MADIRMPQLGETVTEGTITRWYKQVGDTVTEDEVLFEVSTDKVDTEVPSPASGVITEILVAEGATVDVGTVIARVSSDGEAAAPAQAAQAAPAAEAAAPSEPAAQPAPSEPAPAPSEPAAEAPAPAAAAAPPEPPPAPAPEAEAAPSDGLVLSPVVRRLIAENNLDPSSIQGTGLGGRITRADVERAIQERRAGAPAAPTAPAAPAAPST